MCGNVFQCISYTSLYVHVWIYVYIHLWYYVYIYVYIVCVCVKNMKPPLNRGNLWGRQNFLWDSPHHPMQRMAPSITQPSEKASSWSSALSHLHLTPGPKRVILGLVQQGSGRGSQNASVSAVQIYWPTAFVQLILHWPMGLMISEVRH